MRSIACLICDLSITNILNQKSPGLFLDSAILDPMDKELMAAIVTTKLLLGEDNLYELPKGFAVRIIRLNQQGESNCVRRTDQRNR